MAKGRKGDEESGIPAAAPSPAKVEVAAPTPQAQTCDKCGYRQAYDAKNVLEACPTCKAPLVNAL